MDADLVYTGHTWLLSLELFKYTICGTPCRSYVFKQRILISLKFAIYALSCHLLATRLTNKCEI